MSREALWRRRKDERARAFYERYGFIPFAATPRRLFLPLGTLAGLDL